MAKENQVCDTADAPVSFKFSVWMHFGFPVPRNDKGEKVADEQNICRHCLTVTNKHIYSTLLHIYLHSPNNCCLINADCAFYLSFLFLNITINIIM